MSRNEEPGAVVLTGRAGSDRPSHRAALRQAWRAVAVVRPTHDRSPA